MLNIFKKKSKIEVLNKQYQKLLKEAYNLSTVNRQASDAKRAEAERLMKKIEDLENSAS